MSHPSAVAAAASERPGARIFGALAAGILAVGCSEREPPAPSFVEDRAGLLDASGRASIESWHAAMLRQYDIDYRVHIVTDGGNLAAFAVRHFEQAGIGGRSASGRGLLLVVDAVAQRVRLEVARELEPVFVDAFVSFVEREQMAPFFAAGRVGDGIVATTELIAARAEEAAAAGGFDARRTGATSTGAGAEAPAPLGTGYERPATRAQVDTRAGSDPLDTVAAYVAAMAARDASSALDLYTPASREMMAGQVVTRGQMDNLVRTYRACPQPRAREDGDFAVVDHPGESGACSPWLLVRGADGRWRLDLATMQEVFRFDTRNHWGLARPDALGGYAFAFAD
jgi:uncharacterized membrane protein YgcG